ncbi:MAG: Radical domain protein [Candidatus Acidoferrum typicum]|nr:Radical domain protein [Candidatus Acidoferrum typicum]
MTALMQELESKALGLGVPLNAHLDVTYRCNERCTHCYLDHDDHGEMALAEIKNLLDQLADAGVLFLTLSGGEILMRMDFFDILKHARQRQFCVRLKTNGFMIREKEADALRNLGVQEVRISIYSHRAEIHDGITKLPGSLKRSLAAIRLLKSRGVNVMIGNVLMVQNVSDYAGVKALAKDLGVEVTIDPTITPRMDGDRSLLQLGIRDAQLADVFRDSELVGNVDEFCALPGAVDDSALDMVPCSAGHTYCYISPYGDVYPCVQFPLPCGNVRKDTFLNIWRNSTQMNEVRSIRARDLPTCSSCAHVGSCTRCPGLAYMEGNMRGPSSLDCEKSFARTRIPSANMISKAQLSCGQDRTGNTLLPAQSFSSLIQITIH